MRIARFLINNEVKYGIIQDTTICELKKDPFLAYPLEYKSSTGTYLYPLSDVKLLAPCLPSKLVCIGLNYRPHAQETNQLLPSNPLMFIKPSTSVIGPDEPIIMPRNWKRVDYEGELGVVIGKKTRYVTEEKAADYIMGYTCVNDVTERHLQKEDGQWTRSKGFDTFAPIGPWIETEVNPHNLKIETYVNQEIRQSDHTGELIFGILKLISFISEVMTLLPGDIISTGTPAGIAPLKPGDVVEIKIEKIGTLRNPVVAPAL